jgi:AbrB family looped-hinge helix DNA binding protein
LLSPRTFSEKDLKIRKVRIDSKGRISIPSELRKNFGLGKDSEVNLVFDLKRNVIFLVIGQGSVKASIDSKSVKACGASGSGSNTAFPVATPSKVEQKGKSAENPDLGPEREAKKNEKTKNGYS